MRRLNQDLRTLWIVNSRFLHLAGIHEVEFLRARSFGTIPSILIPE